MTIFDKMGKFIVDFVNKNHRLPTQQEYDDYKQHIEKKEESLNK